MISTDNIISSLINAGSDAAGNLFQVDFEEPSDSIKNLNRSNLTVRLENFPIPARSTALVSMPYQGTVWQYQAPALNLQKSFTIPIRLDSNYDIYKFLKDHMAVGPNGIYDTVTFSSILEEVKSFNITVTAYSLTNKTSVAKWYWKFKDCYVTNIESFQMSYQGSNPVIPNVTFIYGSILEGPVSQVSADPSILGKPLVYKK